MDKISTTILNNMTEGLVLVDRSHGVKWVNKAAGDAHMKYFAIRPEAESDLRQLIPAAFRTEYEAAFGNACRGEPANVEIEFSADNNFHWFEYKLSPVYDDGLLTGVAILIANIDKRKQHDLALEESARDTKARATEIDKYNRELSLLTRVNDIVLHAADEQDLYNKVCHCLIVYGKYRLAWVAQRPVEGDPVVRPLVAHGVVEYLDGINIRLDDAVLAKGPTATAMLQGVSVITNNVTSSAGFQPWLERAKKFGIASSLVIPMNAGDGRATLNIYSERTDAFDRHELGILERLAANTALAARNIRTRREKLNATRLLAERVKELNTIYGVSRILMDEDQSEEDAFSRIVNLLPGGWQHTNICEACIEFGEATYKTAGWKRSTWSQEAPFVLQDGRKGCVTVAYLRQSPGEAEGPFLAEERALLNSIAETITIHFNKSAQQKALYRSEARFRGAFEGAAIGMAIVSLDGKWLQVNDALCSMVGYTEHELRRLSFQQITHPDDLGRDLAALGQLASGEIDSFTLEKRYVHKNGLPVWINLNVASVRDDKGAPMYFVSQIENITERVESQLKFRNLVEQSLVGVYILQDGMFVYTNPWIATASGYTEEELVNFPIDRFVHEEDLPVVYDKIDARLRGEVQEVRYELRAYRKDRSTIWLEMFGSVTDYRGSRAIIGTMVDITDKKAVHDELIKSEANLRSVFETVHVAYLLADEHMNIIAFNRYFSEDYAVHTGIEVKVGANLLDVTMPARREFMARTAETVLRKGESISYEICYTRQSPPSYFHVTVTPVQGNGKPIGLCIAGQDITNRKNLEMEREKAVADIMRRNKDLEEFTQIVSHNVRGPLASILGLSAVMHAATDDEERDFMINGIGDAARRLDAVIRDLNNILQVKRDNDEPSATVDLQSLVSEVLNNIHGLIDKDSVTVETDLGTSTVVTRRSWLHDVFYNLMSNSIKFRRVNVPPVIRIASVRQGDAIIITVADNGTGINLDRHGAQLFQLNKRFTNNIEGKGLGLFLVKTLVDLMGGSISADSKPGEGTTFTLRLPVRG